MVFIKQPKSSFLLPEHRLTVGEKYFVKDDCDYPKTHYNVKDRPDTCCYAKESFAPLNPPRVSAIPELLKAPVEERLDHHQPVKILTTDG